MTSRKDVLFMDMCEHGAEAFSTCSKRQYYAIIVDSQGHVIGTGYNGGPKGMGHCNEGFCPRANQNSPSGSIYDNCIAIHAEANAIIHSDYTERQSATLYVNGSPCYSCAKLIANSGIQRVVCKTDKSYAQEEEVFLMLMQVGIEVVYV